MTKSTPTLSCRPSITTNTTFSNEIIGRTDELIRYLQDNVGVDFVTFQHLWFTDQKHANSHKEVFMDLFDTEEQGVDGHIIQIPNRKYSEQLAKEVEKIKKTKYSQPVFIYPNMNSRQIIKYYTDLSFYIILCLFPICWIYLSFVLIFLVCFIIYFIETF